MALGRVVRRFLALLALGWVLLLVALLASIDEPASGAMGVLVDASNVVTELRAGTPVDVGSLLRIGDVVVAVDGVVLGERRLKVVMAEVAKADVHTFTVRRL